MKVLVPAVGPCGHDWKFLTYTTPSGALEKTKLGSANAARQMAEFANRMWLAGYEACARDVRGMVRAQASAGKAGAAC